jgi:hypothetical protein
MSILSITKKMSFIGHIVFCEQDNVPIMKTDFGQQNCVSDRGLMVSHSLVTSKMMLEMLIELCQWLIRQH